MGQPPLPRHSFPSSSSPPGPTWPPAPPPHSNNSPRTSFSLPWATGAGNGKSCLPLDLATRFPFFEIVNSDKNATLRRPRHHHQQASRLQSPRRPPPYSRRVRLSPRRFYASQFRAVAGQAISSITNQRKVPMLVGRSNSRSSWTGSNRARVQHFVDSLAQVLRQDRQRHVHPQKTAIIPEIGRDRGIETRFEDIGARFEPVHEERMNEGVGAADEHRHLPSIRNAGNGLTCGGAELGRRKIPLARSNSPRRWWGTRRLSGMGSLLVVMSRPA